MKPIDFVILWVDGNDPAWLCEKSKYLTDESKAGNGAAANRFRDWDFLRYWFRGVETFAPWVNKIYFITWGHVPGWLNTEHPKLRIVKHEEFIPKEYLPTFNSSAIELNLHRIEELSEQFVLFNDDMYLVKKTEPTDFFKRGLPREAALLDVANSLSTTDIFPHMHLNDGAIINKYFQKRKVLGKHFLKFFAPCYGKDLLRNILLAPMKYFSVFRSTHSPISHKKSTFMKVWKLEGEVLSSTSSHRFRQRDDVIHWIFRDWAVCEGAFIPRSTSFYRCFELGQDDTKEICDAILAQRFSSICLNDSVEQPAFEEIRREITKAFEEILPKESSYERV